MTHLIEGSLDTNGIPDYAGYDVELCDLDADGLGDVIVNAPFSDQYQGKTAIFYGSGSSNWASTLSLTNADTLSEGAVGDCVGWSAACGDFDGDGLDDFVVLSRYNDHGGPDAGTVYLFSGASLPYLAVDNHINPDTADYRLTGTTSIGFVNRLSPIPGDLDGDGFDDILLGSSEANSQEGLVNVFTDCD